MPTPIVKQHVWEGMGQPSETYLDHDPLSGHLGLSPAARFEMCLNCVWAKERRARGQLRLYPLRDWTKFRQELAERAYVPRQTYAQPPHSDSEWGGVVGVCQFRTLEATPYQQKSVFLPTVYLYRVPVPGDARWQREVRNLIRIPACI
jgi:hypothetical protein